MSEYINKLKSRKAFTVLIGMPVLLVGFLIFVLAYEIKNAPLETVGFVILLFGFILSIIGYLQFALNLSKRLEDKPPE